MSKLFVFFIGVLFAACTTTSGVVDRGGFSEQRYSKEEVFTNLTSKPLLLNGGKRFTNAGIIDLLLIDGSSTFTAGKKSIVCTIYQFVEVDEQYRFDIVGPDCCVRKIDDWNFDISVSGSLFTYRLSFDRVSGVPNIRLLSGNSPVTTVRFTVRQFWG